VLLGFLLVALSHAASYTKTFYNDTTCQTALAQRVSPLFTTTYESMGAGCWNRSITDAFDWRARRFECEVRDGSAQMVDCDCGNSHPSDSKRPSCQDCPCTTYSPLPKPWAPEFDSSCHVLEYKGSTYSWKWDSAWDSKVFPELDCDVTTTKRAITSAAHTPNNCGFMGGLHLVRLCAGLVLLTARRINIVQ